MVTIVSECARGCQEAAEDGLSTVPAVALDGALLCRSCAARIGWKLDDVPDVATRARMSLIPGGGAQDNERVTASKDLQIPINPVAMETCDAIVLMLGNWCTYWARVLEVRPPQELETALRGERDVESVQAGTSPQAVGDGILEWSRWLKLILPGILAHPAAVAFHDDLCDVVNRAESRFPRGEPRAMIGQLRPRYCPVCEVANVWVTWTAAEPEVRCRSCNWEFETEWGEFLAAIGITGRG